MKARDYQLEDIESVFQAWQQYLSVLGVAATGLGKTIIFAMVSHRVIRNAFPRKARVLVVANGKELVFQAAEKIKAATGMDCEIEMADYRASGSSLLHGYTPVIVCSVQTLCSGGDGGGRMGKFDPNEFDALIIDEADASTAPSFRRVIKYFTANPRLKILGVTATPNRTDKEALHQIFDSVAFNRPLPWGIQNGWLVEPIPYAIHVSDLDLSNVHTRNGDLNGTELAAIMAAEKPVQKMVQATFEAMFSLEQNSLSKIDREKWEALVENKRAKRTLAFCSSVDNAEMFSNIFNRIIPGISAWVCGKTDPEERKLINDNFNADKCPLLCNYGTHTTGFDSPGIELLVLGRPTKSERLFKQMIGRATRPLPGVVDGLDTKEQRLAAIAASAKPSAILLDFVGISGKHKLVTMADILGGNVSAEAVQRVNDKIRKEGNRRKVSELLEEEEEKLEQEREAERKRKLEEEEAHKRRIVANTTYTTTRNDPFDIFQITYDRVNAENQSGVLTEMERSRLAANGINPDSMPTPAAKQILKEIYRRWYSKECTFKQAQALKKRGLPTNVSKEEASKMLDEIAVKENWSSRKAA